MCNGVACEGVSLAACLKCWMAQHDECADLACPCRLNRHSLTSSGLPKPAPGAPYAATIISTPSLAPASGAVLGVNLWESAGRRGGPTTAGYSYPDHLFDTLASSHPDLYQRM